jgi:3-deoxy-D-manno-octulosonate 8-phosphate phosphatase (KDO 8-P phosphatase)
MKINYKEKLKKIKAFVFDVDGVLTNGDLLISDSGELLRTMNVKDGFAMKYAIDNEYMITIISGGSNEAVRERLVKLGINQVFLGSDNKIKELEKLALDNNLKKEEILVMGDDILDIPILKNAGISCCPQDAVQEVKKICDYVSFKKGGCGAVREIIEQVMKIQKKWI